VSVLSDVHDRDAYPVNWPDDPTTWLAHAGQVGAWVAELDGQTVGHIALSSPRTGDLAPHVWSRTVGAGVDHAGVISRLFVGPAARGRGVASLLLAQAVHHAQERGLHPVLDVVASDASAIALYERLGWSRLGQFDQAWDSGQKITVHCYAAQGPTPCR
jgi:ribosomal protein S18 acetylase RimI-like enzyme